MSKQTGIVHENYSQIAIAFSFLSWSHWQNDTIVARCRWLVCTHSISSHIRSCRTHGTKNEFHYRCRGIASLLCLLAHSIPMNELVEFSAPVSADTIHWFIYHLVSLLFTFWTKHKKIAFHFLLLTKDNWNSMRMLHTRCRVWRAQGKNKIK